MIKTDFHVQPFGSSHDPVLTGVAQGLHDLFPPIREASSVDAGDKAEVYEAANAMATEHPESAIDL